MIWTQEPTYLFGAEEPRLRRIVLAWFLLLATKRKGNTCARRCVMRRSRDHRRLRRLPRHSGRPDPEVDMLRCQRPLDGGVDSTNETIGMTARVRSLSATKSSSLSPASSLGAGPYKIRKVPAAPIQACAKPLGNLVVAEIALATAHWF